MLLLMFLNQIIREKKCHSLQMLVLKGPPKSHFTYRKETKKEYYTLKSKIKNKNRKKIKQKKNITYRHYYSINSSRSYVYNTQILK